jgi:fibronectin type 3 domain-containing protein
VAAPNLKGVAKTSNGVKVTWGAVNGADAYRVYRRGAGQSWVYVTTVTGTTYVDTAVKDATGYYRYTVRAVDGGRYSGFEDGLLIKR